MSTIFIGEVDKVFEVLDNYSLGAYIDYTPPKEDFAPDGTQYRGISVNCNFRLAQGDQLKVTAIARQVEKGFETYKSYEVVKGKVLKKYGKADNDPNEYYFWIVYAGTRHVRECTLPQKPPTDKPSEIRDGSIEVKSGKTIIMDIKSSTGKSNYPETIFKTGRIKFDVLPTLSDAPLNIPDPYPQLSVVLINTVDRTEIIIPVNYYTAEKEDIPTGKYFVILENVGDNSLNPIKCLINNMKRGRIFKIKANNSLWDYVTYGNAKPWEDIGKSMGKNTFTEDDFSYGKYDDDKNPPLPRYTNKDELLYTLAPGDYLCVEQILFDAQKVIGYPGAHQCLRVKIPSEKNITKKPFIWTVYRGDNYMEYASPGPIEIKGGMETSGKLNFKEIKIFDYELGIEAKRYVIDKLENINTYTPTPVWWPEPKKCTYGSHSDNKVKFYNDASENEMGTAGAFFDIENAINEAKYFIFIADWSFHPYVKLTPGSQRAIGATLLKWARESPGGLVAIHTWDHTNVAAKDAQNDYGETILKTKMISDQPPVNLLWRASSRTGIGWSHHQKFVVMDYDVGNGRRGIRAFIGGLDLTKGRFDWPQHLLYPLSKHFRDVITFGDFQVHEWYSTEFAPPAYCPFTHPRQPWHDIHCKIEGSAAWDVVREFVGRWRLDPSILSGAMGDKSPDAIARVVNKFNSLLDANNFVQQNVPIPPGQGWGAQIYRSIEKDHWNNPTTLNGVEEFKWKWEDALANELGDPGLKKREMSVQEAYIQAISQAERFIYIETQYFIGSGNEWEIYNYIQTTEEGSEPYPPRRPSVNNSIPYKILERIKKSVVKNSDFHVYLILPMFPEGDPSLQSNRGQRDLQWRSIEMIVRGVQKEIDRIGLAGKSWKNYLTIGFLANWERIDPEIYRKGNRITRVNNNRRYMIYVHSKMMIVDDRYINIGSANLNERSLAGNRDTEICVGLWPDAGNIENGVRQIRDFRYALWKEHFAEPNQAIPYYWSTPENYQDCAAKIQKLGNDNSALLINGMTEIDSDGTIEKKSGHFCCWDIDGSVNGLGLRENENRIILDGLEGGNGWYIWPTSYSNLGDLIE